MDLDFNLIIFIVVVLCVCIGAFIFYRFIKNFTKKIDKFKLSLVSYVNEIFPGWHYFPKEGISKEEIEALTCINTTGLVWLSDKIIGDSSKSHHFTYCNLELSKGSTMNQSTTIYDTAIIKIKNKLSVQAALNIVSKTHTTNKIYTGIKEQVYATDSDFNKKFNIYSDDKTFALSVLNENNLQLIINLSKNYPELLFVFKGEYIYAFIPNFKVITTPKSFTKEEWANVHANIKNALYKLDGLVNDISKLSD